MSTFLHHLSIKLLFLFILINCIFTTKATAQWYNSNKLNKQVSDIYAQAYKLAQDDKSAEAIVKLTSAIAVDSTFVDGYFARASLYAEAKNYTLATLDYKKGIALDSVYSKPYQFAYSISLAGTGQFKEAGVAINKFLLITKLSEKSIKNGNETLARYQFAIDYANEHAIKDYIFSPKNLGDSINSTYSEYFPSITIDGNKMIFTRLVKDEDFYESDLVDGVWSKAKPLAGKVNTSFNEGAQNISVDGKWLLFTGCNYPIGKGSCDLYISYKTPDGWSNAENLGDAINTHFWESSPSLSPDKRDLYFSSDRPDGYGGKDIWVSHMGSDGYWNAAQNIGGDINTAGDELYPFICADNQTLFFTSNGHLGYGEGDLYLSKKINDTTWSKPENLGYPINTIDDEGSLVVAADGKTAYYASDKMNTKGKLDLYSFELRADLQPPKTLYVKGQVFDAKTKAGLPSNVELTDIHTRRIISNVQTDSNGNYLTTLPIGKNYDFNVNKKGYLFYSENYNLSDTTKNTVFTANIPLQPIEVGASIILKNIFFDSKQITLKTESIVELNKVIQLMNDNPKLKILISGYTDNVGKPQDNLTLSNGRALAVVKYLLASKQIMASRLLAKGFGATKTIAPNTTEAGKALNRRTELSVISN